MAKIYVIILAAGAGERFESDTPKQFLKVAGKTLLEHTIEIFERIDKIDEILIVIHPEFRGVTEGIILKNNYKKVSKILNGGSTRSESSRIGTIAIGDDSSFVIIHDAVRPFVSEDIIDKCIASLQKYDAVDVAIPSADTIIRVDDSMLIEDIPTRKYMMRGQTPQAFRTGLIKKAHILASKDKDLTVTDDCSLVLKYKLAKVFVVMGNEKNIKVTYPEDVYLADKLFQLKSVNVPDKVSLDGLRGKVVVVFGSSRGIGKAIVERANSHGARTYGFSRQNNTDISSIFNVERALEDVCKKEKRIDYIVVSAGILRLGKIETRPIESIMEEINTNYIGAINVIKTGMRYLKETKGSIVLFTSSSYTRGRALYSIYSSAKAAIVNIVQGVAEELLDDGIRINAMNPERTDTPMRRESFGQELAETLLKPEDVAVASLKTLLSGLTGEIVDVRKRS